MVQTAEKAIADYIRGHRDPSADLQQGQSAINFDCKRSGDLFGVAVHEGRNTEQRPATSIVVAGLSGQRKWFGEGWHDCQIEVQLITHRNEDSNSTKRAEVAHDKRALALASLFFLDGDAKAYLNQPASPATDNRAVKPFHLQTVYIEAQDGSVQENAMVETLRLVVVCDSKNVPG